ncbi:hypothetical protein [Microcoleus sp. MON2_D5]|uniref:hypothetical protein n=1 Tax=Microcoleus sp. MON2_D5 TaxID=2818833 RepID=UPI002FD3C249
MPLTTKHAQLLQSNRALMMTFEGFPLVAKLSIAGLALTIGVYAGINALKGTASDMVQVCIRNKQALQCADKIGKPYIMTKYHAEQWKADGVPSEVVFQKTIPATNPHKAAWMLLAAGSIGVAGVVFRSLQNSERQLAGYEFIAEKRDLAKGQIYARAELLQDYRGVAIDELHLQADLEAAANDRAATLKQCEVLAEADIKIAALEAEEAVFEAETAGLSEEKKREYMDFLQSQKTPFMLTGTQTLDSIAYPGDKIEDSSFTEMRGNSPNINNDVDTFGISEIASNKPEIALGLLHPSETKALPILKRLASSRKSLLNIAGTGGGKTVTQSCLISLLLEMCPKTEFWGVSQKNDSYCGLREKGRITIFDITNLQATLDVIHHVWKIYNTRRMLPEEKRENLSPVRLLLGDWFSISLALEELSSHPAVKASKYLVEMVDIVLNGRDFNVCLWADLQSFNLEAIGMKADKNSRQNFNLLGLGNYYTNDEGVNESYGVLNNMINDHFMVPNKETRIQLLSEFERLKPVSMQHERPILFVTLEPPTICLQADIRHYQHRYQTNTEGTEIIKPKETDSVKPNTEATQSEDSVAYLKRLYSLEAKESDCQADGSPSDSSEIQLDDSEPLSDKVSGFIWTVRGFGQMYPNQVPEQLFQSVSEAAQQGQKPRDIIRSILKCGEKNDHPTRSYTRHGKSLLLWLIDNYDDGTISALPEIKKFLES